MKIIFYGTREYDHYYFDVLAADPEYGCEIRFLTANLDADTAPLAQGGDAVCAFVNADCSAPVLEKLAQVGIRCLLLRCAGYNNVDLAAAKKRGITVLRVPGYSPEAVAEHAMALAQAANRRHVQGVYQGAQQQLCAGRPAGVQPLRLVGGHRRHRAHRRGHGAHLPRIWHDGAGLRPVQEPGAGRYCALCGAGRAAAHSRPYQSALPADSRNSPHDQR